MLFKNKYQLISNGQTSELKKIRADILEIFNSAIKAVDPYNAVSEHFDKNNIVLNNQFIDLTSFDNIFLAAFGKASVGMSQSVCDSINIKEGIAITNDTENKVNSNNVHTFFGGHPIPNENSYIGAEKIQELIEKCGKKDLLIVLISGGGSALLSYPRVDLKDLQNTTNFLLKCGADINEINTVRKHLSYVKGGQLVKNAKCKIVALIISDIIGDPLEFISSGPTYPDSTTYIDAEEILKKYNLMEKIPDSVKQVIFDGLNGNIPETPKKNDPIFKKVENIIIANNNLACEAAKEKAKELGYHTLLLTTSLDGEAKDIGTYLTDKVNNYNLEVRKIAFISGGETTVTIKGNGTGGRNQEMVLSSVNNIAGKNIVFSSFATDGIDGTCDTAGAIADGFTRERSNQKNIDYMDFLKDNNSYEFFKKLGDFFITGPTGTNVMDIQIIIKYS